jgi:leader peptidase (prepilin peptidase) / N-methyltransferase
MEFFLTPLLLIIFLFGLCIGSFLNVLIYRLPLDLSLNGRSYCPKCKKKISWYDNIPLLSFILLKGKCRQCHSPISFQYPLVELLTGVIFVAIMLLLTNLGQDLRFKIYDLRFWSTLIYTLWVVSAFLTILIIDLKHQIIPDQLIYSSLGIVAIYEFLNLKSLFLNHFPTAVVACLFFYFLHKITKGRGMGFGDVKLAFLIGLILGFPRVVIALYLAFLTGALVGVILILIGKKRFKEAVPFGPFLAVGTIVSLFWGKEISQWITALLF